MAVLVPNISLPKGCFTCRFKTFDDYDRTFRCTVVPNLLLEDYTYSRHPCCPLVEVAVEFNLAKPEEIVDKFNSIGNPNIYESKGENK